MASHPTPVSSEYTDRRRAGISPVHITASDRQQLIRLQVEAGVPPTITLSPTADDPQQPPTVRASIDAEALPEIEQSLEIPPQNLDPTDTSLLVPPKKGSSVVPSEEGSKGSSVQMTLSNFLRDEEGKSSVSKQRGDPGTISPESAGIPSQEGATKQYVEVRQSGRFMSSVRNCLNKKTLPCLEVCNSWLGCPLYFLLSCFIFCFGVITLNIFVIVFGFLALRHYHKVRMSNRLSHNVIVREEEVKALNWTVVTIIAAVLTCIGYLIAIGIGLVIWKLA